MSAFWLSLGVIFVAELGDKSQLMAIAFAARYRFWTVLAGISLATLLVHLASVAIGDGLGAALPSQAIGIAAGVAFIGFGFWTLRGDELDAADEARAEQLRRSAIWTVAVAFFIAELGDKTMLATITLATEHEWIGTWLGSTVGMVAADALAIGLGALMSKYLPERVVKVGAAALFFIFGALLIAQNFLS